MPHIRLLCSTFLKSLVISRQVETGKDSKFIREEIAQNMDVDRHDESDEAKDSATEEHNETATSKQNKSQKKKKKLKKRGKQLIQSPTALDILGFSFDNTGDWTSKDEKRCVLRRCFPFFSVEWETAPQNASVTNKTSVETRKGDNTAKKEPKEATKDNNTNIEGSSSVVSTNNKKNKKRERRRRKSSSSIKNSFSIDDISELNIDELFSEK